jgi:hypothetical protein
MGAGDIAALCLPYFEHDEPHKLISEGMRASEVKAYFRCVVGMYAHVLVLHVYIYIYASVSIYVCGYKYLKCYDEPHKLFFLGMCPDTLIHCGQFVN